MATVPSKEIILKVPIDLRIKLVKILKQLPSGINFEELSFFMGLKYNLKLQLFSSDTDEVVLAVCDENNETFSDKSQHTKDELEEFKNLLNRIDFKEKLNNSLQPVLSPNFSTKYVEIKISIGKNTKDDKICNKNFFDCATWKINNIHQIFIGHIYDPSKFWICFHRVHLFQQFLWEYYDQNKKDLRMKSSDVRIGSNCVVVISDLYYRGRIVRADIHDNTSFRVFLYDFGVTSKVNVSQFFYMDESFEKFPASAVRAMLTNVSPTDEEMWPEKSVARFIELTENKNLFAQIVKVHKKRRMLEIYLFNKDALKNDRCFSINYRLVHDGFAKVAWYQPSEETENNNSHYRATRQFLYFFPPFEMIEGGAIPSTVSSVEELKQRAPWDALFPNFYKYEK